jgi:hypothetical protein
VGNGVLRELIEATEIQKQALEDLREYVRTRSARVIPDFWIEDAERLYSAIQEVSLVVKRLEVEVRIKRTSASN